MASTNYISCECIAKAVADTRQGVVLQLTPHCKKISFYEILHRASDLVGSCEHGNKPSGSIKCGGFFFLSIGQLLASQDRLCSMELVNLKGKHHVEDLCINKDNI